MELDYQKLAEETLNLGKEIDNNSNIAKENIPPASPGVIFKIEFGAGTYCLRGVPSNNLKEDYEALYDGSEYIVEGLNLNSEKCLSEIEFFPLEDFEVSCLVEKQLMNKRIPYEEELICNISDPGFSWWMDLNYPGIKIIFHSFCIEDSSQYIKLGALGDSYHICDLINISIESLSYMMPINEFSCSDKSFTLACQNSNHPCFQNLKSMFLNGDKFQIKNFSSLDCDETQKFQEFCNDVSALRSLWIRVDEIVQSNRGSN